MSRTLSAARLLACLELVDVVVAVMQEKDRYHCHNGLSATHFVATTPDKGAYR
ncbi:hypothetical protein KG088_12540 [Halomonas sp. TRM85114]|uniref:hypothetical protein n=1 Tax=Halomonas jincaotanensis TaxID=2810616 RepID=UPI001BD4FBD4|nr:hypothetical protein [Halomonas jincaotanensis]MBS9404460.1 hypothetical protein [Halomonas jincaotanensis]